MPRGVDHIVLAVKDLETARDHFEALGFTATPIAHHPFGTKNALVQLDGAFLELLAIEDESRFPERTDEQFSFAHFNKDFLGSREGASMLVLRSTDIDADRQEMLALGLHAYPRFDFGREAILPDGSKGKVAFSNTFVTHLLWQKTGFFLCHNLYPEMFWQDAYKSHENGVAKLERVLFVAANPSDHHEFLGGFSGQREMRSTSAGIVVDSGDGLVEVLTPAALKAFDGVDVTVDMPDEGGIAALVFSADLEKLEAALKQAQTSYSTINGQIVVQAEHMYGCAFIFCAA